jgi:myo-inositol-1-phosphate synthase
LSGAETIELSFQLRFCGIDGGRGFANSAPNLTVDIPVMMELSERTMHRLPERLQDRADADEDDSGARLQSSHAGHEWIVLDDILGNRDGEVLEDPGSFNKEESKLSVLDRIRRRNSIDHDIHHKVRINYYRRVVTTKGLTTSIFWLA